MIKLFGILSGLFTLFLVPLNLRLFSDALRMSGDPSCANSCTGSWILFVLLALTTCLAGVAGWKGLRRA